jgi:protein-tyrosine phosphatase
MAAALLSSRLTALGSAATVRSGGMLAEGEPQSPEAIAAMAAYGLDIATHRSHVVTVEDLERADLTLAVARENLRHAVVTAPAIWPRAFTLRELVRRGDAVGPRPSTESLADWLARAHDGRERAALLGDSAADDVPDPTGGPPRGYTETAATLSALLDQLAGLCWGAVPAGRNPGSPGGD